MNMTSPIPVSAEEQPANPSSRGHIRAMRRSDIPAVQALFTRAFHQAGSAPDFAAYVEALFFDNPNYSEADSSLVYDNGKGAINSAILALPMPFSIHGRRLMGRLLCAYMSDGTAAGALGAARIARSLRASQVEMCFTDNASPVSADHWIAGGGAILSQESLEWRRVFRPLSASIPASGKIPRFARSGLASVLSLADRLILRWKPSILPTASPDCLAKDAPFSAFLECVPAMTERFSVRPIWSREDFDWLTRMAAMNGHLGRLQCRVVESKGRTIGAFLFFANPKGSATVLNLLCEEGCEVEVVGQMFASLAADGHAAATGMVLPFFMNALMRQRRLTFRHRGYFCLNSRHEDLAQAAKAGQIYVGGLASERWSKLVTGF